MKKNIVKEKIIINYQVKIYKLLTGNIFSEKCKNYDQTGNLYLVPSNLDHTQKTFSSNCQYKDKDNAASFILHYCVESAFLSFSLGSHKQVSYKHNSIYKIKELAQQQPRN